MHCEFPHYLVTIIIHYTLLTSGIVVQHPWLCKLYFSICAFFCTSGMWSQSDGTKESTFTQILWRMSTSTMCSIRIPTGLMTWYVKSLDFFWNFSFASSTLFACMIVNYILNTVDLQKHGHNEDILSVAQCPPNLLATSGYDGEVIVWNMVSGHIFCHLSAPIPREYEDQSCMSIFFFLTFYESTSTCILK